MITSSDKVFEVSRRAMFAFAALPTLLAVSALAQTPGDRPVAAVERQKLTSGLSQA